MSVLSENSDYEGVISKKISIFADADVYTKNDLISLWEIGVLSSVSHKLFFNPVI